LEKTKSPCIPLESFEFLPYVVTPANAGVQKVLKRLDTGFRRYDDFSSFGRNSKVSPLLKGERVGGVPL
jgi:hypothetical protein